MDNLNQEQRVFRDMYRRWIYMIIAVVAALLMRIGPVFSFQEDKGIIYVRSFTMDMHEFVELRTDIQTGVQHVEDTMSVWGLYCCYVVMVWGSILCILCFFNNRWRVMLCVLVSAAAGLYYMLLVYYALRISDEFFATLYPTLTSICPAVVLQAMVLVRKSIIRTAIEKEE